MTEFDIRPFYDEYRGCDAYHVCAYGIPVALVWDADLAYWVRRHLIERDVSKP